MAINITECACCGNRDSSRFIQKSDGYICKTCGVWFRYETEEEKAGCMDGRRRLKNYRFEDAYETFMEVLDKYPESIDALWGSLLARYGVVFVKGFFDDTSEPIYCFPEYDEYGGRRFQDERAYKMIMNLLEERGEDLRLSDFYEKKAKEIDRAIAKYSECKQNTDIDIFICVKISAATAANPQKSGRTEDYEYANKVYNDLKKRGVNAFFSFVTLKNNVESDDLIWVNLVKSKKMLIIGSTEEYLDSVWVKSEWKRWLYLGREKDLYICSMKHDNEYPKSILPRELASLHPQVYTLDTYEKMLDELCEGILEEKAPKKAAPTKKPSKKSTPSQKSPQITGSVLEEDWSKSSGLITEYKEDIYEEDTYLEEDDSKSTGLILEYGEEEEPDISDIPKNNGEIVYKRGKREILPYGMTELDYDIDFNKVVSIALPTSFTCIPDFAFNICSKMQSITIPESVTEIGEAAFCYCTGLKKVSIPSGVSVMGNNPFAGCNLEIEISPKNKHFMVIDNNLYSSNGTKMISYIPKETETSFAVPSGVKTIGGRVFFGAFKLTEITIPKTVTEIGDEAFYGCDGVKNIYYGGSAEDWKRIAISPNGNDKLVGGIFKRAKIHYNCK